MLNSSIFKLAISVSLATMFFVGCGGSDDDSVAGAITVEETLKTSLKKIEPLNTSSRQVESGRELEVRVSIDTNDIGKVLPVYYYLLKDISNESNETGKAILLGSKSFELVKKVSTYDAKFILPSNIDTNYYKLQALIDIEKFKDMDANASLKVEPYIDLNALSDEKIQIFANDGKADLELVYLSANANEESIKLNPVLRVKNTPLIVNKPLVIATPKIPFEIGKIGGKVFLNDSNLLLNGAFGIKSLIADAKNIKISACIKIDTDGECQRVDFYRYTGTAVRYDEHLVIDSVDMNGSDMDVIFDFRISEVLLKDISSKVLNNNKITPTLTLSIVEYDQSSTEDQTKNTIDMALEFNPILLGAENVDNSKDLVAPYLGDFNLSMEEYLVKKHDYNLTKVGNLLVKPTLVNPTQPVLKIKPIIRPIFVPKSQWQLAINPVDLQLAIIDYDEQEDLTEPRPKGSKKVFSKHYAFEKYGSYFGAGISFDGKAELNTDGANGYVGGAIKTKIMGTKYKFAGVDAGAEINPGSLGDTGYDISIELIGINLYTKDDNLANHGLTTSSSSDKKVRIKDNVTTVSSYNETTQSSWLKYTETRKFTKAKGIEQLVWAGPIPVTVTAKARGEIGIIGSIELVGISKIETSITPYAVIGASASGGVGVGITAGIGGDLDLVKEEFEVKAGSEIFFEGDDNSIDTIVGSLTEAITNIVTGPKGDLYLFVKYPDFDWCKCAWYAPCSYYPCHWHKEEARANLANFSTSKVETILLDKEQTIFEIGL